MNKAQELEKISRENYYKVEEKYREIVKSAIKGATKLAEQGYRDKIVKVKDTMLLPGVRGLLIKEGFEVDIVDEFTLIMTWAELPKVKELED